MWTKNPSQAGVSLPSKPELSTHNFPECSGPMWYVETGKLLHYHCRIGHSFSGQSLLAEKSMALESALWSAVNALKDKVDIADRLYRRVNKKDATTEAAEYFRGQAESAARYARVIADILLCQPSPTVLTNKKPRREPANKLKGQ